MPPKRQPGFITDVRTRLWDPQDMVLVLSRALGSCSPPNSHCNFHPCEASPGREPSNLSSFQPRDIPAQPGASQSHAMAHPYPHANLSLPSCWSWPYTGHMGSAHLVLMSTPSEANPLPPLPVLLPSSICLLSVVTALLWSPTGIQHPQETLFKPLETPAALGAETPPQGRSLNLWPLTLQAGFGAP